jgi:hypothetical protein
LNKGNLDNLTRGVRPALHAADPDTDVLLGLVQRAQDGLRDARSTRNSLTTRFAAAYSAAFWLARVALEASGYRLAGSEGHRTILFQTLAMTLEWNADQWRRLDDLHRFRNRFDYGDVVEVPANQVEAAIAGAQELLEDILRKHPNLSAGATGRR